MVAWTSFVCNFFAIAPAIVVFSMQCTTTWGATSRTKQECTWNCWWAKWVDLCVRQNILSSGLSCPTVASACLKFCFGFLIFFWFRCQLFPLFCILVARGLWPQPHPPQWSPPLPLPTNWEKHFENVEKWKLLAPVCNADRCRHRCWPAAWHKERQSAGHFIFNLQCDRSWFPSIYLSVSVSPVSALSLSLHSLRPYTSICAYNTNHSVLCECI